MTIRSRHDPLTIFMAAAFFTGSALVPTSAFSQGQGMGGPPTVTAGNVVCTAPCINSAEIQDGQVGTGDLANDAVTGAKIAPGAVGTSDIADGAVTEAKLSFDPNAPLPRVVFVEGDDTALNNGTALLDAFDDIGTAAPCSSPPPSAADPCLVKVGPGVFDVDDATLSMVDHVDVEGAGQGVTVITGATADLATALLIGADAELRHLTVENTRGGNASVPVRAIITGGSDMRISHVTAIASGAGNDQNQAISVGGGLGGAPVLSHVTAIVGPDSDPEYRAIVVADNSDVQMTGVTADSSYTALAMIGGDAEMVTVQDSHLSGDTFSLITADVGGSAKVAGIHSSALAGDIVAAGASSVVSLGVSQLNGVAVEATGGMVDCVFVLTDAFVPHVCNGP